MVGFRRLCEGDDGDQDGHNGLDLVGHDGINAVTVAVHEQHQGTDGQGGQHLEVVKPGSGQTVHCAGDGGDQRVLLEQGGGDEVGQLEELDWVGVKSGNGRAGSESTILKELFLDSKRKFLFGWLGTQRSSIVLLPGFGQVNFSFRGISYLGGGSAGLGGDVLGTGPGNVGGGGRLGQLHDHVTVQGSDFGSSSAWDLVDDVRERRLPGGNDTDKEQTQEGNKLHVCLFS